MGSLSDAELKHKKRRFRELSEEWGFVDPNPLSPEKAARLTLLGASVLFSKCNPDDRIPYEIDAPDAYQMKSTFWSSANKAYNAYIHFRREKARALLRRSIKPDP